MRSMTGYGRCRAERDGREMTVEVRSVNHRFLDVACRLPRSLSFLDDAVRKGVAAQASRGHVDVFVSYANHRTDARLVRVDAALASAYQRAARELADALGTQETLTLAEYARLPDVLTVEEGDEDQAAVRALFDEALAGAMRELTDMREREGENMRRDLLEKTANIEAIRDQIALRAPQVVEGYRDRLRQRLSSLLEGELDEARFATEVALFADRAAIDEELVRLVSHIGQIRAASESREPVGRQLDFLVQELNREVNTIGSKALDAPIAQLVVRAKGEIEKLREQVQNVE